MSLRRRLTAGGGPSSREGADPLEIVAVLCVVAWLLGLLAGYTGGGAIHLILLLAATAVTVRLVQTNRRR